MVDATPQQKFYQKNKNDPLFRQRKLEIMKKYYNAHKEARKIKQREYRKSHLELVRTQEKCRDRVNDQKIYRKNHPEKVKFWYKTYFEKNYEKIQTGWRKYYLTHQKQRKEYIQKNIEHFRTYRYNYVHAHLDHYRKYNRQWRENNPEKFKERCRKRYLNMTSKARLKLRLRNQVYSAFIHYSTNGKTRASNEYGIDYNAIYRRLGPKPNDEKVYHIDHVIPLSWFDFDDPEQIKAAFAPENHQWLEASKNMLKGDKWVG